MLKGIYLGAFEANHPGYDIVYQDINGKRDLSGDMLDIDLKDYDFIIATPPCNFWSRANYRRLSSDYSLKTRILLPSIIDKLINSGKPFIVENVRNDTMFSSIGLFDKDLYVYRVGRHTYWSNVFLFGLSSLNQAPRGIQNLSSSSRQGGLEVFQVVEFFLDYVHSYYRTA